MRTSLYGLGYNKYVILRCDFYYLYLNVGFPPLPTVILSFCCAVLSLCGAAWPPLCSTFIGLRCISLDIDSFMICVSSDRSLYISMSLSPTVKSEGSLP